MGSMRASNRHGMMHWYGAAIALLASTTMAVGQNAPTGSASAVAPLTPSDVGPAATQASPQPTADDSASAAGSTPTTQPGVSARSMLTESEIGTAVTVSGISVAYAGSAQGLPAVDSWRKTTVNLSRVGDVWHRAGPRTATPATFTLGDIGTDPYTRFSADGLKALMEQIVPAAHEHGYLGVQVGLDANKFDDSTMSFKDGSTELPLLIVIGHVGSIKTMASGDRLKPGNDPINSPEHERIVKNSPLQPGDPLRQRELDDYLERLNRYQNRRVGAAVAPGTSLGEPELDYLVSESKPWLLYGDVSNTGTKSTSEWRERIGLVWYQPLGIDDVFTIDYSTASFESHAVLGSYEFPLLDSNRLRLNIAAAYSQFDASDVGQTGQSFNGTDTSLTPEAILNIRQYGPLFVDGFAGLSGRYTTVDQSGDSGSVPFLEPYVGVRAERITTAAVTSADLRIGWTTALSSRDEVDNLGRSGDIASDYWRVQGTISHSFFLDALFDPSGFETGFASATEQQRNRGLINELAFQGGFQYAFNQAINPQSQDIIGGFFTVRGYEESIAAGDSGVYGRAEYRLHIPALLLKPSNIIVQGNQPAAQPGRQAFTWRRPTALGRADWDLIFRTFIDAGRVYPSLSQEHDQTLVGAGVGLELQVRQNVTVRVDWGVALHDVESETGDTSVNSGDSRVHFLAEFAF